MEWMPSTEHLECSVHINGVGIVFVVAFLDGVQIVVFFDSSKNVVHHYAARVGVNAGQGVEPLEGVEFVNVADGRRFD